MVITLRSEKSNPYIIPALIIAAAILVGSWMVVQSNKEAAEHRQRLHREAQLEADRREVLDDIQRNGYRP